MSRVFILSFILFLSLQSFAQDYIIPTPSRSSTSGIQKSSPSGVQMHFSLSAIYGKDTKNNKGETFTELYFGKGYSKGEIGSPNLPAFKKLIQIPHGANVEIKVLGYSQSDLTLGDYGIKNLVYPNQPSPSKSDDIESLPFHFDIKSYSKKGFQETPIATIQILGSLRGISIARIEVSPVDYNPSTGVIRVYNDIDVEIRLNGVDEAKNKEVQRKTYSPYFESLYKTIEDPMSSKGTFEDHPDLMKYPVKMVIVSHRMFEETLQPLIQWKTKKGFTVDVGYTDEIGGTVQDIKDFVHGKYNNATEQNPAPSFLVLVGDVEQVVASATGSATARKTDLYYASVDGDYFPEMYYGRLSAQNTAQLQNIINKIIYYEKYQFSNPEYLDNATLIAGVDGNWNPKVGEPTVKYGTKYYFNESNGYNTVWGYGVANDPNNPNNSSGYTGCYDSERISVGFINYTAHCSEVSWSEPLLSKSSINSMTNVGMYPMAIGNCCTSADFGIGESIGEAWIRAENRGAVTYIGSSPNSYWYEDFYWAVGAFPMVGDNNGYVPTYDETTLGVFDAPKHSNYLTTSGLVFVGNLAVTEVDIQGFRSQSSPLYYWQAYNVLGDPSLMPYFTQGSNNLVFHNADFPLGITQFKVLALPGSYVALSMEGVLIGTAFVDQSGEVEVEVTAQISAGNVDIVVTRPQTIPYFETIPAVVVDGSYLVLQSYHVNDEAGNNNGLADYGESFSLNTTIKNIGNEDGVNISASLSGIDEFFTIVDGESVNFGNIATGETFTMNSCFSIQLSDDVPNNYEATFVLTITDGTNEWLSKLKIKALAPEISILTHRIDDEGNGIPDVLDPGETAYIKITVINKGNSNSIPGQATLSTSSEYLTINGSKIIDVPVIEFKKEIEIMFSITAEELTPLETSTAFNLVIQAGNYRSEKDLEVIIGYIPDYIMGSVSEVTSCKGRFYDSGGASSNYSNNENKIITFYPKNELSYLKFEFTEFSTESGYDYLFVYNGVDTSAPLISGNGFSGTNSPGTVFATNAHGALTFKFTSDPLLVSSGWKANFECIDITSVPECVQLIAPQDLSIIATSPLQLKWELVSGALSYDIYVGKENLPENPLLTTSNNIFNYSLDSHSSYLWKVVPTNSFGSATECPTWTFSTVEVSNQFNIQNGTVSVCNGDFYDSGGASANYSSNENYIFTITPVDPGKVIKVSFTRFGLENNYDFLKVYNGLTTSSELISSLTGAVVPDDIVATNASGALTFHFTSDHSIQGEGWEAKVTCESLTTVPLYGDGINVYPNPFSESISVKGLNNVTKVEISNTLGSIVYSSIHKGDEVLVISTNTLPKGLYLVSFVNSAGERTIRRLIKQ
jgi:hypothetical protein